MTILIAALALPAPRAQDKNESVTIEDLGFTQRLHVGARAAGMAGTYQALGDDAQAMMYNPAGLSQVRRIELGLGFQHQSLDLENVFYGSPNDVNLTSTDLDFIAGAYPVPTYRGSLVVAAGVYRVFSSDIDILNRGFNTTTDTFDDYRLQQSGSVYSYNLAAAVDLAPKLSVGASLFILDGTIDALTQFTYENTGPFNPGDLESESLVDDARVEVDGYGAVFGLLYHPLPELHVGLSISTPTPLDLAGDAFQENALYYFAAADEFVEESFVIDTEYTIPFRVDTGVSVARPMLVVAADVGYSDWTQAKIGGKQVKDENLDAIFRDVLELRLGAEFTVPGAPIRLRSGYAYLPYPLEYLQADRITGDAIAEADVESQRQVFSAGAGFLVGRVLALDAAAEFSSKAERRIATLSDERSTRRLMLSASYRF